MTNEEINRTIQFIIQQQAQFAADGIELRAAQQRTEQILTRHDDTLAKHEEIIFRNSELIGELHGIVTRLAHVTSVGLKDLDSRINALIDAQLRTDAKIEEDLHRTDTNI